MTIAVPPLVRVEGELTCNHRKDVLINPRGETVLVCLECRRERVLKDWQNGIPPMAEGRNVTWFGDANLPPE